MPSPSHAHAEPRKQPVQARSTASVEAILEGTIQVLLSVGKDSLTTTRVALRAGVSVGTLYQYFPNKRALLQAVLRRHLDGINSTVAEVCRQQTGRPLAELGPALVTTFLNAKMRDPKTSVALYAVSSDVDGVRIARELGLHSNRALVDVLASVPEPLARDPESIAAMLQGSLAGISRRLVESPLPAHELEALRDELIFFVSTYLQACIVAPSPPVSRVRSHPSHLVPPTPRSEPPVRRA